MLKPIFKTLTVLGAACLALTSCNTEPKASDGELRDKSDSIADAVVAKDTHEDLEESVTLPSSLQVATIFKKSGLKFIPGITNPTDNVIRYNTTNVKRAVNLGIYSSDLAYAMLNRQFQESKNYLKATKDLGSQLGLNRAFEANNLAERFDKNIGKEDSLLKIVSDIQMQTDILLEDNKQKYITAIAFAGAWIESLYIASKVYGSDKNKNVSVSLVEQLTIADKISRALKICERREPECKMLNEDINSIMVLFKNCSAVKSALDKGEEPDYEKVKLSEEEFSAIAAKVSDIRQKLIN
jgi:hypothetical protein